MKPLQQQLASSFPPVIRQRGRGYHVAGRVVRLEPTERGFEAMVRGNESYRVRLGLAVRSRSAAEAEPEAGRFETGCSCPYFAQMGHCKHIWAAILEADQRIERNAERLAANGRETSALVMFEAGVEDAEPLFDATDAWDTTPWSEPAAQGTNGVALETVSASHQQNGTGPAEPHAQGLVSSRPAEAAPWLVRMQELEERARRRAEPLVPSMPVAGGRRSEGQLPKSEVRYTIDVGDGFLVERLSVFAEWRFERTQGEAGRWSEWRPIPAASASAARLADPQDRLLVALLLQVADSVRGETDWVDLLDEEPGSPSIGSADVTRSQRIPEWSPEPGAGFEIPPMLFDVLLPKLRASGKAWMRRRGPGGDVVRAALGPLLLEPVYEFELTARESEGVGSWVFEGELVPAAEFGEANEAGMRFERIGADEIAFVHEAGLIGLTDGVLFPARFGRGDLAWLEELEQQGALRVPQEQTPELLERLWTLPRPARFEVPAALAVEDVRGVPEPELRLRLVESIDADSWVRGGFLEWGLHVRYGSVTFPFRGGGTTALNARERVLMHRDRDAEARLLRTLEDVLDRVDPRRREHWQSSPTRAEGSGEGSLRLGGDHTKRVVALVEELGPEWRLVLDGQEIELNPQLEFEVEASGIDWFKVDGEVTVRAGDRETKVGLPVLLQAAHERRVFEVEAGSNTGILLTEEARQRLLAVGSMLTAKGRKAQVQEAGRDGEGRALTLPKSQLFVLESLLSAGDSAVARLQLDENLTRLRESLHEFEGIAAREQPAAFRGDLREYQKLGLGWLWFLRAQGLGGCLADDMGLGKTVQVLALLQGVCAEPPPSPEVEVIEPPAPDAEAVQAEQPRLFLVVAPKSVVPNWLAEIARFTPELQALDYTGPNRRKRLERTLARVPAGEPLLLVTTYSSMRLDALRLRTLRFDTVILDEAQAIKNPRAKTSIAARSLVARQRIALTGTPVENRLSDLVSIFDFLNPGMVKHLPSLTALTSSDAPSGSLVVASQALRPLILRRTKDEVLTELPEKTEQTILCELDEAERRRYDELAAYYRERLQSDQRGSRNKLLVLEALLRLRQAACHQGLLNRTPRPGEEISTSAKLELLTERVEEVLADRSHKALVFSQFTSMLAFVRERFDARGWRYAYLDGKTRDREAVVSEFQEDPDCRLFLISLKAGGVGLNLTAADYVFLLDPWWNPAVEQQAIDRAHRIGQSRPVMAYRLLTEDTVEERVAELQDQKRGLADLVLGADKGLIADLSAEDVARLLGPAS